MPRLFYIEIDIGDEDDHEKRTEEWAKKFGCTSKIITNEGPGGGNPLYRIIGPKKDLERLFKNYCRSSHVGDVPVVPRRPPGGIAVDRMVREDVRQLFRPRFFRGQV